MTRDTLKSAFLSDTKFADAARVQIAGDASNRKYDRLTRADGATAILMDAPPERGEDTRPFVAIAEFLLAAGLSAPRILARDESQGFLLLEDLGDDLFARVLQRDAASEEQLYASAVDVLSKLHSVPPPPLPAYDTALMTDLAALAFAWYQRGADGQQDDDATVAFRHTFAALLDHAVDAPSVAILRDYHAENLLWLPARDGVARVGLLDFQDAHLGHPAYDLVSVLQDARRDVDPEIETRMVARYVAANDCDPEHFGTAYAVLGVQRNLRILGVFARLCIRDGKPHYVDLIPRVWSLLERNLAHPQLSETRRLLRETLPQPRPEILQRLKDQCATPPTP